MSFSRKREPKNTEIMKRIIVPIDFSEHSEFALKAAAKLANKNNAKSLCAAHARAIGCHTNQ